MKICLLGSGSSGNSIYVESRRAAIIIDQGFSHKILKERLDSRGLDETKIKAILLSHEHGDHIGGVGITARKLNIPVYGTQGTLAAKPQLFYGDEELVPIESGVPFTIGSLEILPFSVSHDAAEPVQFCVTSGKKKVAIATDLGFVSTLVQERLKNSDLVIIEANHDVEMLKKGPYDWQLKQRIMSKFGHLSNRNAADILYNLSNGNSLRAVLAHISEENNTVDCAVNEVNAVFERFDHSCLSLIVATQNEATSVLEV